MLLLVSGSRLDAVVQAKQEDDVAKWPNCNSKWTDAEGGPDLVLCAHAPLLRMHVSTGADLTCVHCCCRWHGVV